MVGNACLVLHPFNGMKSKNGERSDQGGEQSPTSTRHTTAPLHHQDEGEHNEESMPDASSQTSQRSGVETAADDDASMNSEIPSSRAIGMPNSMNSSQEPTAAAATSSSDESGNERNSLPQHEEDEVEVVDEVYESTRIFQRNKRLLISRLYETAPRGRLSMVNLCRRGVGVEEAKLLKEAILANPQLSVLKLCYNALGDEGAAIIASALQLPNGGHHAHLSLLDMGFNAIGDAGCEALAVHGLAGNLNLQTLYLSGNQIGEKGALSIAGAILRGTALLKLYLSANKIGPIGAKAISGAIAKNDEMVATAGMAAGTMATPFQSIQRLHLGSTGLLSEGLLAIPGMLLTNKSLRHLCLANNHLNDQDMATFAKALSQNKEVPLVTLQFSFNDITCQGVEYLMNAVWGSSTLRELKFDNNKIKDRGAQLCAVALTAIALEDLDLSLNPITTPGIKALMKNISENTSLKSLGLTGIPVDQNASKAISFALAFNSSLEAIFIDNCNAGYSSQRHIVAGVVSNRTSSLRVLAGFHLAPIALTLGMPRLPQQWSNDQVLGFFRLMWEQWLLKSRRGTGAVQGARGPAPPAAVAAAAKIALASLGNAPETLFHTQAYEKPAAAGPPVDPGDIALLERTDSGTLSIPAFVDTEAAGHIVEPVVDDTKVSGDTACISKVRTALDDPERRNKNLQWLRNHFRSLNDIGRLPFNTGDLWQLHQYYFSPPFYPTDGPSDSDSSQFSSETDYSDSTDGDVSAPPPTPAVVANSMGRAVSFQTLGDAFVASGVASTANLHKRPSEKAVEEIDDQATKRPKNMKPRIAYYPRLQAQLEALGARPMEQTLALLRQLKYSENVMFAGKKDPYADSITYGYEEQTHADVEMILLDLL